MQNQSALFLFEIFMDLVKAVILGIIQGLTEFLPISSSGHLVIGSEILNFHYPGIAFEVFLHCGTLLAVVFAFRGDLVKMVRALFTAPAKRRTDPELNRLFYWNFYVVLATLPAVIVGLFMKDRIDAIFNNILITFGMLSLTGLFMLTTKYIHERGVAITASRSIIIGLAQALAIMPGLSRSGSTIFAGMVMGVNREVVARFSFIMSIPAILGAVVLKVNEIIARPPSLEMLYSIAAGTAASVISGYFAIVLLMSLVRKGKLQWFGYYCLCVSATGFAWYFMR